MRRSSTGAMVLVAAAAAVLSGGPAAAQRARMALLSCDPAGAQTIAVDAAVRVYSLHKKVYGCANNGSRDYVLGDAGGICVNAHLVGTVHVAGDLVGYSVETCGIDTGSSIVDVLNLRTGKMLVQHAATTVVGVEGHQVVNSLVLTGSGEVAWIGTATAIGPPKLVRQVARVDTHGFAVLDSGAKVKPRSLELHGSTVSWTDAGVVKVSKLS